MVENNPFQKTYSSSRSRHYTRSSTRSAASSRKGENLAVAQQSTKSSNVESAGKRSANKKPGKAVKSKPKKLKGLRKGRKKGPAKINSPRVKTRFGDSLFASLLQDTLFGADLQVDDNASKDVNNNAKDSPVLPAKTQSAKTSNVSKPALSSSRSGARLNRTESTTAANIETAYQNVRAGNSPLLVARAPISARPVGNASSTTWLSRSVGNTAGHSSCAGHVSLIESKLNVSKLTERNLSRHEKDSSVGNQDKVRDWLAKSSSSNSEDDQLPSIEIYRGAETMSERRAQLFPGSFFYNLHVISEPGDEPICKPPNRPTVDAQEKRKAFLESLKRAQSPLARISPLPEPQIHDMQTNSQSSQSVNALTGMTQSSIEMTTGMTETGTGLTGMTQTGTGLTGMTQTGTGLTGMTETGTGLTGMTQTGTGLTGMTETGTTRTESNKDDFFSSLLTTSKNIASSKQFTTGTCSRGLTACTSEYTRESFTPQAFTSATADTETPIHPGTSSNQGAPNKPPSIITSFTSGTDNVYWNGQVSEYSSPTKSSKQTADESRNQMYKKTSEKTSADSKLHKVKKSVLKPSPIASSKLQNSKYKLSVVKKQSIPKKIHSTIDSKTKTKEMYDKYSRKGPTPASLLPPPGLPRINKYLSSTMRKSLSLVDAADFPSELSNITAADSVKKRRKIEKTPNRPTEFKLPGSPSKALFKAKRQGMLAQKNSTKLFTTGFVEIVDVIPGQISAIDAESVSGSSKTEIVAETINREETVDKARKPKKVVKTSTPNKTSVIEPQFDFDLSPVKLSSDADEPLLFNVTGHEVNSEEIVHLSNTYIAPEQEAVPAARGDQSSSGPVTSLHSLITHKKEVAVSNSNKIGEKSDTVTQDTRSLPLVRDSQGQSRQQAVYTSKKKPTRKFASRSVAIVHPCIKEPIKRLKKVPTRRIQLPGIFGRLPVRRSQTVLNKQFPKRTVPVTPYSCEIGGIHPAEILKKCGFILMTKRDVPICPLSMISYREKTGTGTYQLFKQLPQQPDCEDFPIDDLCILDI